MRKPDDTDRTAPVDTTYALTRTVAPARRDRVPTTTPASVVSRARTVGPNLARPGLGEYLIVARRRP
ncbi:MAG TPA: hypothetical protein VG755_12045 [Nannocystaceae bacterium]|nr:hypothetical protein [Nannocystaceae bacterium]